MTRLSPESFSRLVISSAYLAAWAIQLVEVLEK